MNVIEISGKEYSQLCIEPFSAFEEKEFYELNSDKVDEIVFLLFDDGKKRFIACAGIKGDIVKFPFSASFSMLNSITHRNKILYYHEAVKSLNFWAKNKRYRKIVFSLPPLCYDSSAITFLINALFVEGYKIEDVEVNYEYYLSDFTSNYEMDIDPKARQKLRASLKHGISFEKTEDIDTVYDVIKRNREYRGFPLWMSLLDVKNTMSIINMDFFIAKDSDGTPIASAIIYKLTSRILRVIYWGNTAESEELRPMNFLSFNVFKYYKNSEYEIIDIGHSTDDSIPNYGLCDFKQGIGCKSSLKFYMTKEL